MAKNPTDAAAFFDGFAGSFDTLYDGQRSSFMRWVDRTFRSDMFIRFARTFTSLPDLTGHDVLDIGCGSGPYISEALRRGALRVTGVDPAPGMLRLARQRLEAAHLDSRCELIEGFFPGVSLRPHDYAIVMGVLDYVEEPAAFLTALRPVVREAAVISFPSTHWLRTPIRKLRYKIRRCPVYFYDEARIRELADGAGFRELKIYKIPGAGMDYHVWLRP